MIFRVPTYGLENWSLAFCSKAKFNPKKDLNTLRAQEFLENNSLKYYNLDMHSACFALPEHIKEMIETAKKEAKG